MRYYWTCTISTSACRYANGSLANFDSAAPVLTFLPGDFANATTMRWTLRITKGTLFDSTYVTIVISAEQTIAAGIRTAEQSVKVNRNKPVILSAIAYSQYPYNLTYLWRSSPSLPSSALATSTVEKYLKINPYMLDESTRYNFTCTIQDQAGNSGEALVRVSVNRAPRGGNFAVVPGRGASYQTRFQVTASGWYDDDVPLNYLFSYEDPTTGVSVPLGTRGEVSSIVTALGIGNITAVATVIVQVEVFDALNASTVLYQAVTLDPPIVASASEFLSHALNDSTSPLDKIADISLASRLLDCHQDPELCATTVFALMAAERVMDSVSVETDEAIINALAPLASVGSDVVDVLGDVAARELASVNEVLSVADEQLESKRVRHGLSTDDVRLMLATLGTALKGMDSEQIKRGQDDVMKIVDTVGRSLLKDAVPNEGAASVETDSVSLLAQKVTGCDASQSAGAIEGTIRGVGYVLPICEILPVGQTAFTDKVQNKQSPYDLLVEVFDQNVVGDCAPLNSRLMRVVIYDDKNKTVYTGATKVSSGINFAFSLDASYPEDDLLQFVCMYYSSADSDFTPATMQSSIVNVSQQLFRCTTIHLSEFAMRYSYSSSKKAYFDSDFWLLLTMLVACVAMHSWATVHDLRHREEIVREIRGKTQKVASKLAENLRERVENLPFREAYGKSRQKSDSPDELPMIPWTKLLALVILVPLVRNRIENTFAAENLRVPVEPSFTEGVHADVLERLLPPHALLHVIRRVHEIRILLFSRTEYNRHSHGGHCC